MRLAVIPARGGSKRLPRKNIKDFCGKPIISYSIQAAIDSGCFERIIVSTDDEEIASVARHFGAETPFIRPNELSGDHVATLPVINHAIQWLTDNEVPPSFVCCIYATAPFIQSPDIRDAFNQLVNSESDYVFPITTYPFPIQRSVKILKSGKLQMFSPEHFNTRSQDLEEAYHDAGQFYWGRAQAFASEKPIFSEASSPLIIPRYRVQDIDTSEDWIMAELMFKALKEFTRQK